MNKQTITEKYDFKNKFIMSIRSVYDKDNPGPWQLEIQRNSADGSFNLMMYSPGRTLEKFFYLNNKEISIQNPDDAGRYIAHSSMLDAVPLSKTNSIGFSKQMKNISFYHFSIFPKAHTIDKNVFLKDNTYLVLKSIDQVYFKINKLTNEGKAYLNDVTPTIFYTYTYIVPREFDPLNPNEDLFDIYVKNDITYKTIYGDVAYENGEMKTSATGTSKFKLNTIPDSESSELFDGAKKVSTIKVFDYTLYNYEKKKVEVGYGKHARKGIIIPYNFKGEYQRRFNISPNQVFENLNITLTNEIKTPLLDPYEGDIILDIKDLENENNEKKFNISWKIISSKNFERLKNIELSLIGINRLAHEENL